MLDINYSILSLTLVNFSLHYSFDVRSWFCCLDSVSFFFKLQILKWNYNIKVWNIHCYLFSSEIVNDKVGYFYMITIVNSCWPWWSIVFYTCRLKRLLVIRSPAACLGAVWRRRADHPERGSISASQQSPHWKSWPVWCHSRWYLYSEYK